MPYRFLFMVALVTLPMGCDRRVPEPPARASTPGTSTTTVTAPQAIPPSSPQRFVRSTVAHWVAIGDLHGDLEVTRRAFRLAGAMDEKDHWVGGKLVVVQTGDLVDRGNEDRAVLDLLEKLQVEAKQAGGELVLMNGNHDIMNVSFDFRYVTPTSFAAFADIQPTREVLPKIVDFSPRERGRAAAFAPGGVYARKLAERPVVVQIGKTVFAHGGVLPEHITYGLDRINDEVRSWMLGQRPRPPEAAAGEQGVVWTRAFSDRSPDCARLQRSLKALNADRMVIGHTPQREGITSACDGKVWRIDTGLSHYYGGPMQILEMDEQGVRVKK